MSSTIYDLGYQSYGGARYGRRHAVWTLFVYSLRAAFGIGRSEAARRVPMVMGLLIISPAIIQVGVASAAGLSNFIHYSAYLEFASILLALFASAQAPEILVTDRQTGALSLYLSRPLHATDYALAKLAALTVALLILTLAPQLLLFGGKVLLAKAPFAAFRAEAAKLVPIFAGAVMIALFFASVSLALSSFALKRAFATAAVIAFFLLLPGFASLVRLLAVGALRRWAVLLNPANVIVGFSAWLFELEARRRSAVGRADLPGQAYLYVILVVSAVGVAILLYRYRRDEA